MSVWVELFHGRDSPAKQMNDWGFTGPVVGPFDWVHTTYGSHIRGGRNEDGHETEFEFCDGLVKFQGKYYGDWSVFDAGVLADSPDLLSRMLRV